MTDYRTIVGLDLSLTSTGIAVSEYGIDPALHVVTSVGKKGDDWHTRYVRLALIRNQIVERIPDGSVVFVEGPSYMSASSSMHDRSGLWWQVYESLDLKGCQIVVVAPSQRMKYATGTGNAKKDTVMAAAIRRYPDINIRNNDEADGCVMMAMGLRMVGRPIDDPLPKSHLDALDKIEFKSWVQS